MQPLASHQDTCAGSNRVCPCQRSANICNRSNSAGIDIIILDTLVEGFKGGTGKTCDWNLAAQIVAASPLPVFLAGGITPENAAEGIALYTRQELMSAAVLK